MTRNSFRLAVFSLALLGVLMLATSSSLFAQCPCTLPPNPAPPAPAAPVISLSAVPYPTPSQYVQPTELIFTITLTDSTNGATIAYNVTGPNGAVASGSISAPNSSSQPHGTVTVTVPINATSGYTATAYAYIPANTTSCPTTPASPDSSTTTQSF
ncbi:MAG: hypothetical protein ABR907_13295 [Terracidiphilus sp.]|jgi:hypothetical protein